MVNAKDILNEYDKIKTEGREKLQPLFEEKNKRRKALVIAFSDDSEEKKVQSKIMRKKLNSERKKGNKDLIENYQKLYNQKNENEKQFQILLEDARKRLNSDLDEDGFRELLMGKSEETESKETLSESYQDRKRADILSDTQKNDQEYAKKMEGWYGTTMKLRREGIINDSDKGVDIKGLCSLASTESHNKVLEENFGEKVKEPYNWEDSSGKKSVLNTVLRSDANKTMKTNNGKLKGEYNVTTPNYIKNTIFPWIKAKYDDVETENECFSVLQQINPDLFTYFLLKDDNSYGLSRQGVELKRNVYISNFSENINDNDIGDLFLVGNA